MTSLLLSLSMRGLLFILRSKQFFLFFVIALLLFCFIKPFFIRSLYLSGKSPVSFDLE